MTLTQICHILAHSIKLALTHWKAGATRTHAHTLFPCRGAFPFSPTKQLKSHTKQVHTTTHRQTTPRFRQSNSHTDIHPLPLPLHSPLPIVNYSRSARLPSHPCRYLTTLGRVNQNRVGFWNLDSSPLNFFALFFNHSQYRQLCFTSHNNIYAFEVGLILRAVQRHPSIPFVPPRLCPVERLQS